jgi:protein-L-isoaspartate(D-aspartate) O-methyltransferase
MGATQEGALRDSNQARACRAALIRELEDAGELRDPRVADAIARVPRHIFVPGASLRQAYANRPLPIGFAQTISQPTTVAVMTRALRLTGSERVLEIGTGSGYQAAVLGVLAAEVYTLERIGALADEAKERLVRLGYRNVHVGTGDGYAGWSEHAPYDRILVTAAPEQVPPALFDQLAEGGILVAPVGPTDVFQRLLRYSKSGEVEDLGGVYFVPMVHAVW